MSRGDTRGLRWCRNIPGYQLTVVRIKAFAARVGLADIADAPPAPARVESRYPALIALVGVMALQWLVHSTYVSICSLYFLIAVEAVLLILLAITNASHTHAPKAFELAATVFLLFLASLDNAASAVVLNTHIIQHKRCDIFNNADVLLRTGAAIFVTNIVVFAIWYWQTDRGGPYYRHAVLQQKDVLPDSPQTSVNRRRQHFMFAQDANTDQGEPGWGPRFLDYLYVSFTNVVAFSPTDTVPLSRPAKVMMAVQSTIAVTTLVLVIARAVNVLAPESAPC